MAEQLGSAVLTVSVDDQQLKVGLQAAERQAKATGQNIEQAFTKSGKPIQTAVNGLQYFVDAQGKARDIAGKFLTIAQQQEAGLAGIGTAAAGAGRGLGGFGGAVGGIGATAAGAAVSVAAIGAAIVGIGAASVQSAGGIQRLNAAFVGLTGSAEAARQLRQDLFTLSKTTPFKNEEILQAAQRFLAVGVEVDKLQGTINRVGAIAAQSGQPLERLALIYAQVYAKGRLQGEENLQLLEAGVDLTQELSAVTGKSGTALQDAMSKGQIGINDFNKALLLATGEMSALQLAGRAVDVQFNNVFDNLGQLFGGFAQAIAPALSASFKVINDIFDTAFPSLESITKFFEPLTQAAERFSKTLEGNPQLIAAIAAGFKSIGSVVIENIVIGLDTVRSILSKIDGKELIKGLIQVELLLRKALLAGRALSATIIKNAELTFRGITNPVQFGKDIFAAGGFKAFIEKEYGQVYQYWTAAAQAKPLPFPDVQQKTQQPTQGDLSNKLLSNEDLKKRWADSIAAANRIRSIQEQTAIESARPGLTGIGIGALSALAAFREAQRQEQNAQAQLRIKPGDTALQSAANEAAENVKLAAAKTKADLQDAFKAAQDSVRAISRSIEDSVLALQQAQNQRGAGLNEFLSPQQVTDRQQQANQQLRGAANNLIEQLRDELGLNVQFSLTGTTEQRNAALGRFLTSGRQEIRAAQDIRRQEQDLRKAQADLATAAKSGDEFGKMIARNRIDIASGRGDTASTMNALATSTVNQTVETQKLTKTVVDLVKKKWNVVVNIEADGQTSVYGDAVNGGF